MSQQAIRCSVGMYHTSEAAMWTQALKNIEDHIAASEKRLKEIIDDLVLAGVTKFRVTQILEKLKCQSEQATQPSPVPTENSNAA
jgi:hypothetical protein